MSRTTASPDRRILQLIRGYTLMDDAFMLIAATDVLGGNKPLYTITPSFVA